MGDSPKDALTPIVQNFCSHLQSKFPGQFGNAKTAAAFKQTVILSVKSVLPPVRRPGRPPQETVTRAIELRKQGKNWSAIYAELIKAVEPEHGSTRTFAENKNAKYDLSVAKSRLRSAVRSRLNRDKRRAFQGL
jgi:hypothetical protein